MSVINSLGTCFTLSFPIKHITCFGQKSELAVKIENFPFVWLRLRVSKGYQERKRSRKLLVLSLCLVKCVRAAVFGLLWFQGVSRNQDSVRFSQTLSLAAAFCQGGTKRPNLCLWCSPELQHKDPARSAFTWLFYLTSHRLCCLAPKCSKNLTAKQYFTDRKTEKKSIFELSWLVNDAHLQETKTSNTLSYKEYSSPDIFISACHSQKESTHSA